MKREVVFLKIHLRLISLFVAMLTVVSLFGCKKEEKPEVTEAQKNENSVIIDDGYVITCPKSKKEVVATYLAKLIRRTVSSEIGISMDIQDDWYRNESDIPEKEILVGKTDRPESISVYESLGENRWSVSMINSKIVIAGNGNKALQEAANYFIDNFISGKDRISVEKGTVYMGSARLMNFSWSEGKLYNPVGGGYPRFYELQDGTLLLAVDGMTVYRSEDDGLTWDKGVHASQDYKNTANAALYQTEDGTVYLAFRAPFNEADGTFNSSIQVSYSTDNGYTWKHHSTLYQNYEPTGAYKGVWEPHFGMMNGKLTCFYANDSTNVTTYQNIEYLQWDEEKQEWGNRTIVFNGEDHKSRDGMPVWQQLSTGEYVCVVEAWDHENDNHFCVQLSWSEDGVNWSDPVAVMRPNEKAYACAAPYIVELPTGQLLISCQTKERGIDVTQMATCLSDGTNVRCITEENFYEHDYPTVIKSTFANRDSSWNGMYVYKNYIFTCSAGVIINRYEFDPIFLEKPEVEIKK